MKVQALPENPAIGDHSAKLVSITLGKSRYGSDAFIWTFEVTAGESQGCSIQRTTGTQLKIGEAFAKTVEECLGRQLKRYEQFDTDDLIGREYFITVGVGRSGEGLALSAIKPAK